MKTPIEVKDIRKGDLIRWEFDDDRSFEMRADFDHDRSYPGAAARYLLNRPTPPVELPTEPTLGILTYCDDGVTVTEVAEWMRQRDGVFGAGGRVPVNLVTAFTPAVAVPKAALDELRAAEHDAHMSDEDESARNYARKRAINTFLTAVDEANGDRA